MPPARVASSSKGSDPRGAPRPSAFVDAVTRLAEEDGLGRPPIQTIQASGSATRASEMELKYGT